MDHKDKITLSSKALTGIKWSSVSQFGRSGIQFITTIILARLLVPTDFGLIGMAVVVIGFINLFKDLGTSSAIIQSRESSEELLSSIYWVNVAFGLCAMTLTFLISPFVAELYHEPKMSAVLRALSLTFFISGLSILHQAILERNLSFTKIAKIELCAVVSGSVAGIGSALLGAGVWSLVFQSLMITSVTTGLLWIFSGWKPKVMFHWHEVKAVSSYSLHLTAFNIFNYAIRNADYLLIGRYLGAQDLGYYTLAYNILLFPVQNISSILGRVMFPFYSRIQSDNVNFRSSFLKVAGAVSLITFPLMLGVIAVNKPFVLTVFGEQWKPIIVLINILALVGLWQSIGGTVGGIYQAKGRTDLMFRWGVAAGTIVVISFIIGLKWGIVGVASAYAISTTMLMYPNFAIPFRLIDLRMSELGKILLKPFLCSLLMFITLLILRTFMPAGVSNGLNLGILVPAGIAVYIMASWMMNKNHVQEVLSAIGFKML